MWMTTCFLSTTPIALRCSQRLSNFSAIDNHPSSVDGALKYSATKYFTMPLQTLEIRNWKFNDPKDSPVTENQILKVKLSAAEMTLYPPAVSCGVNILLFLLLKLSVLA